MRVTRRVSAASTGGEEQTGVVLRVGRFVVALRRGRTRASASRGCPEGERQRKKRTSSKGVHRAVTSRGTRATLAGVALGAAVREQMEPTRVPRSPGPRLVFLFATLVLTLAGKKKKDVHELYY